MAGVLQHLRSSTLDKRPNPASMVDGQVAINYASGAPGMFFKDSNGALVKVGPVHVGSGAPNAVPASGGTAGNSIGEQWLDTSGGTYVFKIWDGSAWRSEAGEFVNVTGDTMTGALVMPNGSAASPALAIGSSDNGLYSPGTDQVAISTNGTARLFVDSSGRVGIATSAADSFDAAGRNLVVGSGSGNNGITIFSGSASAGSLFFADGTATSAERIDSYIQYEHSSQALAFATAATEKLRITSTGRLGLGTSSPGSLLDVNGQIRVRGDNNDRNPGSVFLSSGGQFTIIPGTGATSFSINDSGNTVSRFVIDSSGRVGIGATAPSERLSVNDSAANAAILIRTGGAAFNSVVKFNADDTNYAGIGLESTALVMRCSNSSTPTERARIDSSGRLLVGTSSARSSLYNGAAVTPSFQLESGGESGSIALITNTSAGAQPPALAFGKTRSSSFDIVSSGDGIGRLTFQAADGTDLVESARIEAVVDGTPGANDMPGRLVFSVTPDGLTSPKEAMRIRNNGEVNIGTFDTGYLYVQYANGTPSFINRTGNDGTLLSLRQDSTEEGTISVSGTTVSYNGAHLSRWSQLPGGAERTEILRGTVLSNIDEMCKWGDEENEQLNRMKVSDVEGDKNVSGVFQAWDDDDDTYTDDFYCAMTGDFIIRIAGDVTVERGDLLMSAGDGTAKPQDDDIIRSKTIAKVTSTNVSCTYDDGSYCVPCVLMAC